jgi:erythromycin esterase
MRNRRKRPAILYAAIGLLLLLTVAALVFMRFGGFGTGEDMSPAELAAAAGTIDDIIIPERARIIALGEATHGNVEFQQLKLDVFSRLVERYEVRAFALEGDAGGCEEVNRYIHGGEGSAQAAAAAIGFAIYRTEEMARLIAFMRRYNESAPEGEDLRFYGFDMQRYASGIRILAEDCRKLGLSTEGLDKLMVGDAWNEEYGYPARAESIARVKGELERKGGSSRALHMADMLLQHCELKVAADPDMRDRLMAENALWIAAQEREDGRERVFIAGHNSHVARWGSFDSMGKLLAKELGEGYYVIGTDFYKTRVNLPLGPSGRRTYQTFYSHDPLAKAAKKAGLGMCWLDFAKVSEGTALAKRIARYTYMGKLGEGYSLLMRLLPPSYRMFQPPAVLYDGMILVAEANPTRIIAD